MEETDSPIGVKKPPQYLNSHLQYLLWMEVLWQYHHNGNTIRKNI